MTRDEALKLLRGGPEGVADWNRRREFGGEIPNLASANLEGANLCSANLLGLDLRSAILRKAALVGAQFEGTQLIRADLEGACLAYARFSVSSMILANMRDVDLQRAYIIGSNLEGADLQGANLELTTFIGVRFDDADLSGSKFGSIISYSDISEARGLDAVEHVGQSALDINSLVRSKHPIPEVFLRGCGLRDEEIAYFRSVVGKPIRFYSCFISYSTRDEEFASRLHNDLQTKGIGCWKWDHDARTGRSIWGEIDQAIRVHDKVVLIASESSLKSPSVNREIERAIQEEDRRMRDKQAGKFDGDFDVLFPVRVDDYIFDDWQHERKADVVKKVIADACGWDKDPAVYAKVRDKLIKDLKPT
jgi:hypothetical protein